MGSWISSEEGQDESGNWYVWDMTKKKFHKKYKFSIRIPLMSVEKNDRKTFHNLTSFHLEVDKVKQTLKQFWKKNPGKYHVRISDIRVGRRLLYIHGLAFSKDVCSVKTLLQDLFHSDQIHQIVPHCSTTDTFVYFEPDFMKAQIWSLS